MKNKSNSRSISPRLIILTEDEKSEKNYILAYLEKNKYSRSKIDLLDSKTKSDPKNLVIKAKKEMNARKNSVDIVWLVFDHDGRSTLNKVFEDAEENHFNIAFSSICFEYWILLHYKYTTTAYLSCKSLLDKSELKYLFAIYQKNKKVRTKDEFITCIENCQTARNNAKNLCDYMNNNNNGLIHDMNPYTDFYKLLDAIDDFFEDKNEK